MVQAHPNALAYRARMLEFFDLVPGNGGAQDLNPNEIGIVAGPASAGTDTYHEGTPGLPSGATYSKRESKRDNRPDQYAAAIDIGEFSRGRANLRHYSLWLVEECKRGAHHTRNIREVIYSPDGRTVKRWDRLGVRSGGDLSHLTHTHKSYFRDAHCEGALETANAYLAHVGLIAAPVQEEEDEMGSFNSNIVPLPHGFAFDENGELLARDFVVAVPAEPAGLAGNAIVGSKRLHLSLAGDFTGDGAAHIRVAIFDGGGVSVNVFKVTAGLRLTVPVGPAKNGQAYNISVGRRKSSAEATIDEALSPVSLLVTIG